MAIKFGPGTGYYTLAEATRAAGKAAAKQLVSKIIRIPPSTGRLPPMKWPKMPGIPGIPGAPGHRHRRRKARITSRELQELILLKSVLGSRSPALTIAAFKMLDRG